MINAIAIGNGAGAGAGIDLNAPTIDESLGQDVNAIAIGTEAGNQNQGQNAIAIGYGAGKVDQPANSIILNSTGSPLNASYQGFYVNPIRNSSTSQALFYNTITKEITYGNSPVVGMFDDIKTNSVLTGNLLMTSDRRLKSEIKTLPTTLDIIKQLNPVSYKKKDSISSSNYKNEEMGFIAQEIQKVLPMLVLEGADMDKTLSVNYISLIPVLTKAIQEQQTQIEEKAKVTDELKKQLDRQQKEIDELRELIKSIKK